MDLFSYAGMFALFQVLMINIVLSGDNAVIIGMVAARTAPQDRHRVILWGMVAAVLMRIVFAVFAVQLLNVPGLMLAGGIVLLWVAWRLYRDIVEAKHEKKAQEALEADHKSHGGSLPQAGTVPLRRAIWQVAVADISLSIDNVLAIAGVASENLTILIIGLVVSIALMGVAASFIARLLERYPVLSYVGVVLILYVAGEMIWEGIEDVPEIVKLF